VLVEQRLDAGHVEHHAAQVRMRPDQTRRDVAAAPPTSTNESQRLQSRASHSPSATKPLKASMSEERRARSCRGATLGQRPDPPARRMSLSHRAARSSAFPQLVMHPPCCHTLPPRYSGRPGTRNQSAGAPCVTRPSRGQQPSPDQGPPASPRPAADAAPGVGQMSVRPDNGPSASSAKRPSSTGAAAVPRPGVCEVELDQFRAPRPPEEPPARLGSSRAFRLTVGGSGTRQTALVQGGGRCQPGNWPCHRSPGSTMLRRPPRRCAGRWRAGSTPREAHRGDGGHQAGELLGGHRRVVRPV